MSNSSLIPERQLVFSPGLAATIGLEEAILLQHLQECLEHGRPEFRGGFAWLTVTREALERSLPFFTPEDLQRVSRALVDKGIILIESPPLNRGRELVFTLNQPAQGRAETAPPEPALPTRRSAAPLPVHWGPGEDLLQLLALNHNIPRQFALDQLEDFIFYWRERGETSHAWENKFRQHVITCWRREQQSQAEAFHSPQPVKLDNNWRPSQDALEIMTRAEIPQDFIEEAIPEFVLYWRERGAAPKELNSKFIQHIRIQWARYSSSLAHSTAPARMSDDWQPAADVFDILDLSHIDADFARSLLPEFIVYWRDSNQVKTSWNSKFLQHVKYHWAKRHQMQQVDKHGQQPGPGGQGRTRDRSLEQDLTDTSWAK
ncbi:MAG: hypothetical protein HKN19_10440 [Halioglobus sp.]|nr:hypothetical protein [Halioglobus sp.]